MRVFIAVNLPKEFKEEIIELQNRIKDYPWKGKLTNPEQIHLTLKFLGDISEEKMIKVKKILEKVKLPPQRVIMEQVGIFKKNKVPAIIWVKILGLDRLQDRIDEMLKFKFEKEKRFMAHVTIARVKSVLNEKEFEKSIRSCKIKPLESSISEFKLILSELSGNEPEYLTLKSYPLKI